MCFRSLWRGSRAVHNSAEAAWVRKQAVAVFQHHIDMVEFSRRVTAAHAQAAAHAEMNNQRAALGVSNRYRRGA